MESARPIKGLGEIALRVENLDTMAAFYETIVGLERMRRDREAVFFRIAEGFDGHTQVLALFNRSGGPGYRGLNPEQTTVDHIAFEIGLRDFSAERVRLENLGIQVETAEHAWVHWRSLYFRDPEGNQVEFVCYDRTA